jgi:diguanylate cyclase (GGDEF)-like protein
MTASSRASPPVEVGATVETIAILVIEDNPADARLIREQLRLVARTRFAIRHADRLSAGLDELAKELPDIILLDLSLPDSLGLDTLAKVRACVPDVPLVVLTGSDDEDLAVSAAMAGAQDYLVKGQLSGPQLARAMRIAVERVKRQRQVQVLAMEDDLTGLHNRPSFIILARQAMKVARRAGGSLQLLLVDVVALKQARDVSWPSSGDQALLETAKLLRATFRESDIVARVDDDEFAALVSILPADGAEALVARVHHNLAVYNGAAVHRLKLSFGVGFARYDPTCPCTLEELLAQAGRSLYEDVLRQRKL